MLQGNLNKQINKQMGEGYYRRLEPLGLDVLNVIIRSKEGFHVLGLGELNDFFNQLPKHLKTNVNSIPTKEMKVILYHNVDNYGLGLFSLDLSRFNVKVRVEAPKNKDFYALKDVDAKVKMARGKMYKKIKEYKKVSNPTLLTRLELAFDDNKKPYWRIDSVVIRNASKHKNEIRELKEKHKFTEIKIGDIKEISQTILALFKKKEKNMTKSDESKEYTVRKKKFVKNIELSRDTKKKIKAKNLKMEKGVKERIKELIRKKEELVKEELEKNKLIEKEEQIKKDNLEKIRRQIEEIREREIVRKKQIEEEKEEQEKKEKEYNKKSNNLNKALITMLILSLVLSHDYEKLEKENLLKRFARWLYFHADKSEKQGQEEIYEEKHDVYSEDLSIESIKVGPDDIDRPLDPSIPYINVKVTFDFFKASSLPQLEGQVTLTKSMTNNKEKYNTQTVTRSLDNKAKNMKNTKISEISNKKLLTTTQRRTLKTLKYITLGRIERADNILMERFYKNINNIPQD